MIKEHVIGFHVAVDQASSVSRIERLGDPTDNLCCLRERQRSTLKRDASEPPVIRRITMNG
jgi:hypothetical protein